MVQVEKPKKRSDLRLKLGRIYYEIKRKQLWKHIGDTFAKTYIQEPMPYIYASHSTILRRKLKDVDMWMQENKIVNLKIAAKKLNGIVLYPGEVFSYWKLIGKPTKKKGYLDGMILQSGSFQAGIGGGLCQMSNLIFWMAVHTPLTIVERHHEMQAEYWGGYTRHNELYQRQYDLENNLLEEKLIVKNSAIMMYSPFLEDKD